MPQKYTVRTQDLSWRQVDEEVVVLDLRTSQYLSINGSGALLWTSLVEGADEVELSAQLVREFDISSDQATADVAAFLERCSHVGIIE